MIQKRNKNQKENKNQKKASLKISSVFPSKKGINTGISGGVNNDQCC